MSKRLCPTCVKFLPEYLFPKPPICMECRNLRGITDAPSVKSKVLQQTERTLAQHGLNFPRYKGMYFAQKGKCAICGEWRKLKRAPLPFVIDHDHETGEARGLLCNNCNVGLGMFKDQLDRFANARSYIEAALLRRQS